MGPESSEEIKAQWLRARMETQGTFFAGRIGVECVLSPAGLRGPGGREDKPSEDRERRGGGMGMGPGGRPRGEGMGPPMGGRGDFDGPRSVMRASNLPPLKLRLLLTNHGETEAVLSVLDFNSALGNFIVQPDKLTVSPGQTVEVEPMISRLGVPGDEIPLTVRLRLDGKAEQQVLTLKLVEEQPVVDAPEPQD